MPAALLSSPQQAIRPASRHGVIASLCLRFAVKATFQGYRPMNAPTTPNKLLPLAAMMLAGSLGTTAQVLAQEAPEKTLKTVTVRDTQESATAAKDKLLVTRTGIAKGKEEVTYYPSTHTYS